MIPINGNVWTIEMVKALRRLHEHPKGYSFERIAEEMSKEFSLVLTRNACIGKARRLGLAMRDGVPRQPIETKARRKMIRIDAPIPHVAESLRELHDLKLKVGLTIYQTREGDCKWPLGAMEDQPPYLYCGKATELGRAYCPTHANKAYNKPGKTWE